MTVSPCPNCNGNIMYRTRKPISAGVDDSLLPGLGRFFSSAKADIIVCWDCGLIRQFASEDALEKLPHSKKWELIGLRSPASSIHHRGRADTAHGRVVTQRARAGACSAMLVVMTTDIDLSGGVSCVGS